MLARVLVLEVEWPLQNILRFLHEQVDRQPSS